MESQSSISGTVCQLSHTNADLFQELAALEDGRNHLDQRFESDLSALNKTISELGPVIDVLLLEKPPPLKLTFGDSLLALRSGKWPLTTLSTVQTAVLNISKVEGNIRASQREACAKKIETADLASKAAGHIDQCSSVHAQVSNAQTQTRALLDTTERHIVRAQQQIEENLKLSEDMANEAKSRDEQAEGNNVLFWATFWIPVVNIITIPISLTMEKENRNQAAACRDMVTKLNAEVQEKSAEKVELEATSCQLNGALSDLEVAGAEAQQTAKQASKLQDQAKALTDQYGLITTRVRDVLRGLGHVRHDVSAELWDETRFTALLALRGMLTTLKERELLTPKSLLVAGIAEKVHVPVVQGPGLLEDLC